MTLGWKTIAEGESLSDLHSTGVVEKLPHNTPFDIELTPMWGFLSNLGDVAGAEWAAARFLEAGAIVVDVEGKDSKIIIHCRANAVQMIPLILAIAAVFATLAFLITSIKVSAPIAGAMGIIGAVAIGAAIILAVYLAYRYSKGG